MATILYVIGGVAIMTGAAMFAFGIPINEFSFGNTMMVAGATIGTGGMVVVALGVAVKHLQRLADMLAMRAPVPPARPAGAFEPPQEARSMPPLPPAPGRVPFPSKPAMREPHPPAPSMPPLPTDLDEAHPGQSFAPALRNPEAPPVTVEDDVSLSPPAPVPVEFSEPARPTNGSGEPRHEQALDTHWRVPPPPAPPPSREAPASYFDSMWPAKPRIAPAGEPHGERKPALSPRETIARAPAPEHRPAAAPRTAAAILKSGVVDGMAYTLYVDGSIEAELPQGTLRFASIDDLRSHLEKNG